MLKKIFKSSLFVNILSTLIYLYCLITFKLQRKVIFENFDTLDELSRSNTPLIICFWHSRLLFTPFLYKNDMPKGHIIISKHGDGEIISRTTNFFSIPQIRGSSDKIKESKDGKKIYKNKGGMAALIKSSKILKNNGIILITPDGPKGPRMRVKNNILNLGKKYNATVLPITYSSSNSKIFNSWDRFMLPLPFGKVKFIIGTPEKLSSDFTEIDMENSRKKIENQLNNITSVADDYLGVKKIIPEESATDDIPQ